MKPKANCHCPGSHYKSASCNIIVMNQDEINESEWNKKENWSLFIYRSRLDNRFIVPKRRGFGATMNFGHKSAALYFIGFMALILSPLIIALVGMAVKK